MVEQKYRWDFIGLSTDVKPTSETSPKVVDGSTYYCSDTSKLYVWCKDNWYERKPLGGGGTTYSDFVGTDGTAPGTAGLVPAPATVDAGKFLTASGAWGVITQLGGLTLLTISQTDYDNLATKDPNTLYIITGA
ncbi:MAG: hypothetical protein J6S85_01210 [Methanobrevibacter sp.]|nr:hypothetical protein [Methanobrevibacter sp.]